MSIRLQADPTPDIAAGSWDRAYPLGSPERRAIEAVRVRNMLARGSRVGLLERLGRAESRDRRPPSRVEHGLSR
jgi:hypothetical protein